MRMDRNEFLNMCRQCAMIKTRGQFGVALNVPDRLRVVCKDIEYYPESYNLSFNANGDTIHTVIIHDLKANAVVTVPLSWVKRKVDINETED